MKFPHKFGWSVACKSLKRLSISFLSLSFIAVGALCFDATNAFGVPPDWSFRAKQYPQAFLTFMEDHFGRAWMHTVQERVVQRMYAVWCDKNNTKSKEKKDR